MSKAMRLDLPVVLPGVGDEADECVARLIALLESRDGVESVHVLPANSLPPVDDIHQQLSEKSRVSPSAALCLHYDPERLSLGQIADMALAAGAGLTTRYGHATLAIRAAGSEDEGLRIERVLLALPGVTAASANTAAQLVRVEYDSQRTTLDVIRRALRELRVAKPRAGDAKKATAEATAERCCDSATRVTVPDINRSGEEATDGVGVEWYHRNRELVWSLAAGSFMLLGIVLDRASLGQVALASYVLAYVFGASDNVGHFLKDVRRGAFRFDIDLLMVVAALGAAALGQWREGAFLLFLFSLGHAAEHYALGRARSAITALAELAPQEALVVSGGQTRSVPIAEVKAGDAVLIKPGERVSVDGVVKEGKSDVNQAPITGESAPIPKSPGEQVFAGSVNGERALTVEVTAAAGDRTLDRVIKLVAEAQTQKAPTQQFTDRFERVFVPVVLIGSVLLMLVPPLVGWWTWSEAIYRALTVLVASSPCALALGTPAAVLAGIAQAARNGVLIKGGAYLEALGAVQTLALDKTGTITKGEPSIVRVITMDGGDEGRIVAAAAAVEAHSQHPLARAVLADAVKRGITPEPVRDVEAVSGRGVRGHVGDAVVEVGRLLMFDEKEVPPAVLGAVKDVEAAGQTAMIVRRLPNGGTGEWLGVLGVADEARQNAPAAIAALRALGLANVIMLTGDNESVAQAIAKQVGISDVRAGLMPEDKLRIVKELSANGRVAMVGDGVNDAPALAHASVGIAMGGAGTAAALETADVALMGDDLGRLSFAVGLSRRARGVIKQNVVVSLGVIAVLVVAAVTGKVGIGTAVIFHEGSTLVVIANGLRLLMFKPQEI
ncbi:MAG: heavy metal translocating P-type ATPase [Gemmatimonadota bacterium]